MMLIKIVLFLFFSLVSLSAFSEAQLPAAPDQQEIVKKTPTDAEIMHQLFLSIESLELDIKVKFKELYTLKGEERELQGVRMLGLDKEIKNEIESAVSLLQEMTQEGGDVSENLTLMHRHLNRRNKQLKKIYAYVTKRRDRFQQVEAPDVNDLFKFEQRINKARLVISDIILSFQQVIKIKESLKIDNEHDVRVFSDLMLGISTESASRLKLVSTKIKNKKIEISNASEQAKKTLEIELNALMEKRKGVIDVLSLLITLMQKHNLETTKLSQLLITSSGTINQQIFDKAVIVGLFVQWSDEFEKWLLLNASSFIVSSVIIVLILFVFRLIAIVSARIVRRAINSSGVKISVLLRDFFVVSTSRFVMFVGVLIALAQAGVQLGPLLAGLGVLGFVVGFALQGVLSNFASGLMILIYRPYDVGDVVEIAKVKGTVKEMSMVSTTLLSFSNERLVIPNNSIWGDLIRNITSESTRRVDLVFKVSFDADIDLLDKIFTEEVNAISAVLTDPEPTIELHKQHETHLEYIVRPWVKTCDYWPTYWALNKSIKKRMDLEGVPKLNPYEFLKPLINKS